MFLRTCCINAETFMFLRSVDLFIGKTRDRREKNYVTKMTPLVYFKQVPKDCSFNMIIKSPNSSAVNIIENKKMELEKSILMYPQRFMDSHNLGKFTLRDGGTVTIEVRILRDQKFPFFLSNLLDHCNRP